MSTAAIVASRPAGFPPLEKAIKERKIPKSVLDEILAEIEPPTSLGAVPSHLAGLPLAPAKAAARALAKVPGIGSVVDLAGEGASAVTGALESGANAAGGVVGAGAEAGGKAVGEGIVHLVEPVAKKMALYALFIFGALALIVFGFEQLLKPVGGPDLTGKVKGAIKLGAAAE